MCAYLHENTVLKYIKNVIFEAQYLKTTQNAELYN